MKNVMSKTGRYLMLAVLPAMLAACSDDEENKPEVKLTLTEPISHVTFVSKGSIELPVRISGIETDPEVSDFMVLPTSVSADNIHFDWDQTEPAGDLPMGEIKDLKVSDVREGEDEGSYILTVDYDATGNMMSMSSTVMRKAIWRLVCPMRVWLRTRLQCRYRHVRNQSLECVGE